MRRILFLFLLLPLRAFALYNGNPSLPMMPEVGAFIPREVWFGVKTGYEFDYVYDRKLRVGGQHAEDMSKRVQKYDSLSNFGVITFNFNDRVELFSTLGAMSCELSHHPFDDVKISYHSRTQFAWGVGGRALLAYWGDLQFGVNAAYVASDLSLSSLEVNGKAYSTEHAEINYTQWQIGIGISYRVDWFIPYIGADFSNFRARIEDLNSIKELIPSKHVTFKDSIPCGMFLGFGLSPYRAFSMNVEVRCINENAVSISADFKF